ncbi:PREDICTED: mannose-P-dolichol utilization defect 1 protein-like [Cyprinodon variegatus]|uniref:mannose-P-dolichol utilization defect 1 protein-like n=1 Tax=Cyprinodon variegatus TaxID=28743 RepID=UPI00074269E5|nr:PREDICTED: mannose-P-dolichol utilization defect 1 protein-like [Cyprinodon variegatus]
MADTSDYPRGSSFMDPLKGILVAYFMPELCYDKFFLDLDFLDVPCVKMVVSKALGIGIILGSVLGKTSIFHLYCFSVKKR